MKSYSEVANRYMQQNKKRTILTILGITLATILVFAIGTFLLSFRDTLISNIRSERDYEYAIRNVSSEKVDKIVNNAEIKDSALVSYKNTIVKNSDRKVILEMCNEGYFERVYKSKTLKGREPEKEGEIILDSNTSNILNIDVNDNLSLVSETGVETNYIVVGISEKSIYKDGVLLINAYKEKMENDSNYDVFVNLNSEKNKNEIITNIMKSDDIEVTGDTLSRNSELLYLTGNGPSQGIESSLRKITIFVIGIIVLCTISVIYNSFNISVMERIRYFGVLKAIGATSRQINIIIFKEGILMGLIALPLGSIIGFLVLKFVVDTFIGNEILTIKGFDIKFYPIVIAITALIVFITIILSVMGPARKAKKVSAVEAMRNKTEIKGTKIKRRKSKLITKLFGIEGSIAYKNIRRTPAKFIITVMALTISLVMFNVFYGFIDYAKQMLDQIYGIMSFDAELVTVNQDGFAEKDLVEMENKDLLKYGAKVLVNECDLPLPNDVVSKYAKNIDNSLESLGYKTIKGLNIYICDDKFIETSEKYLKEGSLDKEALKQDGVIVIDESTMTNSDGKKEKVRATNYKINDNILVPKVESYKKDRLNNDAIKGSIEKEDFYKGKIVARLEVSPVNGNLREGEICLVIHKDVYERYMKKFNPNLILFNYEKNESLRSEAIEYFDKLSNKTGYEYTDVGNQVEKVRGIYGQVEFFVYCFIIVVTIISVLNIFNTISTNLLLRKREFSTLKAIGMEEKQLKKSVMFEGTLYGMISAILGGILSVMLLFVLIKLGGGIADIEYHFAYIPFVLSIIVAVLITYLSTLIPLNRLKKLSIVEGIDEEG